jgi:hypothetical protein
MTNKVCFAIAAIALTVHAASHRDYRVEDREPVHHVFTGDQSLDTDLVSGSLKVIGDGGNTIRVEGERVIRGSNQEQVARAKREVVLDINEKNGVGQLYANGPFRGNDHASENHGFHDNSDREYEVEYNLTIHVPRSTGLRLHNVNGGVQAEETSGHFDVRSVNGSVEMTNVAGSGTASTVNGPTVVTFRENPKTDSAFTSVNGRIDVTFQPGLSADFQLKTLNGSMFTDFESTALATTGQTEQANGRFVYKQKGISAIRIGAGGPQMRMETVNGSIQIKKQGK